MRLLVVKDSQTASTCFEVAAKCRKEADQVVDNRRGACFRDRGVAQLLTLTALASP